MISFYHFILLFYITILSFIISQYFIQLCPILFYFFYHKLYYLILKQYHYILWDHARFYPTRIISQAHLNSKLASQLTKTLKFYSSYRQTGNLKIQLITKVGWSKR